jgi:pSer/pThr/pTyr-binding forkhead associated (FHA) protein
VETGAASRGLYFALVGGLIALFIGIVDLLARSAWVRLVLGRNEGKEWVVDAPQTFIGRNERANIPLFGDPNIAPMHACITKQGHSYAISDGGSAVGTYVNGQRIQSSPLFHGAQIQIGSYALQFLVKHGAAPARGPENFNQAYAIQNQQVGYPRQQDPAPVAYPTQAMPPAGYPTQAMPPAGGPAPGSLYGSAPTQAMPQQSGGFPPQQQTVAYQNPASQPTTAYTPAGASGFTLAAVDGPLLGQRFAVRSVIELGRESASVPMSFDTGVSRRHASISPGPVGVMVQDLGSTNGTFVNGQRVQSANAGPGDLIKIGATTFRVEPG